MKLNRIKILTVLSPVIFLLSLLGCSSANKKQAQPTVYRFSENKLIGYMDKTGSVVLMPKYIGGSSCSWTGLVSVAESDNTDFYTINLQGVKQPRFQAGLILQPDDNDQYAGYTLSSESGILNNAGKLFSDKLIGDLIGYNAALNIDGNEKYFTIRTKDRYGLFSEREGINFISQEYLVAGVYSEGLLAVVKGDGDKAKLGFIDKSGNLVIPLNYYDIEMTAAVAQGLDKYKFDYIDLPLFYRFSEGLAAVGFITDDGRSSFGYIDKKGGIIIKPSYTQARPFSNGYAAAGIDGDVFGTGTKYGFIDRSGHFIVPPQFDDAKETMDGAAPVKIGEKWGLLNIALWKKTGKLLVDPTFDLIQHHGDFFSLISLSPFPSPDIAYRWVDAKGNELLPHR